MERKCYGKINLSLDSLYKREDGYHEIDTIMTRISLFDKLKIKENNTNEIKIKTNSKVLSDENIESNLIYKAWSLLKDRVKSPGVDVYLEKNIPIAAGLAGGSTNCAEMILALNDLWDLALKDEEIFEIGKKLGADVPFFFLKKSARAQGIGEILSEFKINLDMKILLVNDGTAISSNFVYKRLKDYGTVETEKIIKGLEDSDKSIVKDFKNVMEDVVYENFPHLLDIKNRLENFGASKALLSGSGASIFAVFFDEDQINKAYQSIKDDYKFVERVSLIDD
ncbi:4-(cytidine 5'-diphospho)-2-C-methyl-D-erythritol kinase [Anaerococcus hydrogenalis]|uniref:4-diphosphocytidyl-2-C-methyl-D-erythritol kinase n=2 Tax=Anaerococcus hydrogenalis TaxID=33029 RepID=A0A2N6UK58_9FIRM|nr:4-(cytidine 5'-diphospho)-2-C-methyl-D-erythritol kinase [Anaerococcus hydrogenalis]MBS5988606.1 4-(cytidine 5'-diphospho)-2-C-methyl-D-erythritol kinase [Anaerococcus hydrogenalis]MDK7694121.1 4-(cytidine 5'-diphospho)-2-C-methyl-D-erythritol kinase [Anaerococcus hydrogenalis]MDK7695899.1 4-(cytidine 5'-diphospho)-2-C-methyl-D-erythritol kinase [Anaerococcus hydrogenalis]MDK7707148.1 4-(cytidine 5'-diphospho)-2-C-methyl-D-erythritol kinase [Anaerococcus hydrogenalis]PMC82176.1 4-(cytidine 